MGRGEGRIPRIVGSAAVRAQDGHRVRHCPANVGVLPLHSRCPASPMHAPHTLLRPARRPPGFSGGVGRRVCERGRRVQRRRGGAAWRGGHGGGGASGGARRARGSEGALPGGWVGGVEGGRRPTGGWMGGGRPPGRVGRILEGGWPACTLGGGLRWVAGVLGGSGRRGGRRGAGCPGWSWQVGVGGQEEEWLAHRTPQPQQEVASNCWQASGQQGARQCTDRPAGSFTLCCR